MGRPDTDPQRRIVLGQRCREIDLELEEKMALWELWHREIEEGIEDGSP
jgi:hypothetical protein